MPSSKRDVLFDMGLVAASASTAIAVYWSLIKLQRRYWRLKGKAKARIPQTLLHCTWAREIHIATQAALAAGATLKKVSEQDLSAKLVSYKGEIDLVTETDKENEKAIVSLLSKNFPTHLFIGEEEASANGVIPDLTSAPTWLIDPIDGTTNFVHGCPFSCVSIALAVDQTVVVGVVFDPFKDELFLAAKGHGAFLNGKQLKLAGTTTDLSKAVIIQEYGYERTDAGIKKLLQVTERLLRGNVQAVRQFGSGVLDLAYVAAGRVDGVYCGVAGDGWKPWDYAAGSVVAVEAGATMSDLRGEEFDVFGTSMVCAGSEAIARKLVGAARE
ncbi:myo-inositol-1(or 4)-monophosphatase [Nannochloropsis oceanica]